MRAKETPRMIWSLHCDTTSTTIRQSRGRTSLVETLRPTETSQWPKNQRPKIIRTSSRDEFVLRRTDRNVLSSAFLPRAP
ncbi:hypothetical protein ANCCAN_28935 [Ancylostoma caninum]|uniref:Uncharacterized protein n=1 Tax=Ancylostoma caninum TaxID=29170 RepID=A0A368EZW4_ANCCA|nr:hypothetical protein ANCCAN_28935 [Ancylostoma caninum]